MAASGETSQVKFAIGNDADDGDYTTALVAAVTGKKIRVIGIVVTALTTAGVVSLKTGSTTIFQAHLALGTPLVVGYTGVPVCETTSGVALTPNNGTGVDSFITCSYVEVEP